MQTQQDQATRHHSRENGGRINGRITVARGRAENRRRGTLMLYIDLVW